jgi:hypothetical protein
MISDKLYRLALLVIFILALIQIINFFNQKPVIIETKYEHLNPNLLTHQYENLAAKPGDKTEIDFYYRDNRYSTENKLTPELIDPLKTSPGIKCGPKFDWDVKSYPGANNVYGDMVWNTHEPRMVLQNNCLSCNQFQPQKSFNEPTGTASALTSAYDNGMTIGALSDQTFMSSDVGQFDNTSRQMANTPMSSGLPPLVNY